MHRIRVAVALGAALTALLLPASTGALEPHSDVRAVPELPARGEAKHAKLDSALARLTDAKEGRGRLVRVEASAKSARGAELEAAIRAAGGTTTGRYASLIEARLPVRALELVANDPSARRLKTPARPYPQVVVGEGVASTAAGAWHSANTGGAGVEIAIVDVGFAGWQQLPEDELPEAQVVTQNFCDFVPFEGDPHGTAVAEIVHEIAPAAKLHLICIDSIVSLGQAKDYVVANDIPIVNHSAGWPNTSRGDGTGASTTPEGIVADAHAQGVLWVNAAGNYGEGTHWSGPFSDTDDDLLHNFTATDNANDVFLFEGGCVYLKWDDWPTSDQDFDLYLFRSDGEQVTESEDPQTGQQEPIEWVCAPEDDNYFFAISSADTTETPRLDVLVTGGGGLLYSVAAGSVIEPATSPSALAVGAVCVHSNVLQGYSSRGPTIDGRTKPEVVAQDANSSVTYGPATDCLTGFTGSSASSAHVAGAAALIKQANPSLDATGLQSAVQQKTVDILPSGMDHDSGWGRLFLGAAPPAPPGAPANSTLPLVTGLFHQSQTLTASNGEWASAPTLFVFRWLRCDAAGTGCVPIASAGSRSATYPVTAADVGHVLRVRVTASNRGGSTQALSAGTPAIQGPIQPPASVISPSLAGAAQFGQSLSASAGAWSGTAPLAISIEWLRCDSAAGDCVVIVGATTATYVLALEDVGATIRIRVTASNPAGSVSLMTAPSGVVASQAPAIVPPSPPPPGPAGGATPPPPPPQTTAQPRLIVVRFVRTPKTPVAGRRFTLELRVGTRAVSALGATRRVSCSARLGRKTVRPTKSLRAGVARCTWAIPRTAASKRLRSVITVSEGTRSVRRTVTATVRRAKL